MNDKIMEIALWNRAYENKTGMKRRYLIKTYGCQMNTHDSERIAFLLEEMGYIATESQEDADIILYNTCMIRENAEVKVYGHLGQLKPLKREKPDLIIGLCGCMMQLEDIRNEIGRKHEHVDLMFGTNNINALPTLLVDHLKSGKKIVETFTDMNIVENTHEVVHGEKTRAYINIMYGCENFCTYCIVPHVRGKEISRETENILDEIRAIRDKGYHEIMLLGQNVNSYGKTLEEPTDFTTLLERILEIDGIERIRFMTSHPKDCPDELIELMARERRISPHFHLPVQSGSDRILRLMNRHYTRAYYLDLVHKMKEKIPDLSLSTDIIVGFPGETEEDFHETIDLIDEVGYDQGFMFLYSARPGTAAARMEDDTPREVKLRRFNTLLDHMYASFLEKNKAYLGREVEVLVEGVSKNNENMMSGRTDTFKLVHFPGSDDLVGQFVTVRIDKAGSFALEGEFVCTRKI